MAPLSLSASNDAAISNGLELIKLLESRDPITSDNAYRRLAFSGKEMIPYLLDNAGNPQSYTGVAYWQRKSSVFVTDPTVGLVSLYLVECILHHSYKPHLSMTLFEGNTEIGGFSLSNVITIYRAWWNVHKTNSIESIRNNAINPLSGSPYSWFGYNIHE